MKNEITSVALRTFIAAAALVFALAGCFGSGGGGSLPGGGSSSVPSGASLMSISVFPALPASLPKGLTQQFTAWGYYSNGTVQNLTTSVAWSSSATTVATINAAGLATGVGLGATNITESASGITSTFVALTVVRPCCNLLHSPRLTRLWVQGSPRNLLRPALIRMAPRKTSLQPLRGVRATQQQLP